MLSTSTVSTYSGSTLQNGPKICSLPWCRQTGSHLTYQNFPANEIRQMQWLTLLDVAETWKDVPSDKLRSYIICSLHFDTRGNLLRATSTPLVTTAHVSVPPPPAPAAEEPKPPPKRKSQPPPAKAAEKIPKPTTVFTPASNRQNENVSKPSSNTRKPAYAPLPQGPATRESFSLAKKIEIVRMLESGMKQSDVCRLANLRKSTVWCIWKNREKIEQAFMSNGPQRKKLRKSNFEEVDQALFKWYNSVSSQNVTVTGRLLQTMAESFAQDLGKTSFVCTSGWLERFKQRYCIVLSAQKKQKRVKEEQDKLDCDKMTNNSEVLDNTGSNSELPGMFQPLAVLAQNTQAGESSGESDVSAEKTPAQPTQPVFPNSVQATDWIQHTWPKVRLKNSEPYPSKDVFAAEEVGILYRLTPETCWKMLKNRLDTPFDIAHERLTVLVCSNADGSEKRRLLIVGQSRKPSCIAAVVGAELQRLPADYHVTMDPSGWITERTFGSWLQRWDEQLRLEHRHVLLTVNSTPAHENLPTLSNIKVVLIPSNISHIIQPMQAGIVRELKWRYRRVQLERMIYHLEQSKEPLVSLYDGILMLSNAWHEVSAKSIMAAFQAGGLLSSNEQSHKFTGFPTSQLLERAAVVGLHIPPNWDFKDFVNVDDCLFAVDCNPSPSGSVENGQDFGISPQGEIPSSQEVFDPSGNEAGGDGINPQRMSTLSTSEIQIYLDVIKIWVMTKGNSCPQEVHNALSTIESFAYGHGD